MGVQLLHENLEYSLEREGKNDVGVQMPRPGSAQGDSQVGAASHRKVGACISTGDIGDCGVWQANGGENGCFL